MNILIAEDDAVSRRLLRGHLEKWGHTVAEAVDGAQAWEMFTRSEGAGGSAEGGYPVVIVDWMMPLMDGLELIQRIRARAMPRYTYILMLTAKNQKEDVVTGMDAGADDYLTKPFDKEELRSRLQAGQRILDLQAALLMSEKNASVGRLALGVAAEVAGPIAEVLQSVIDLRHDANALFDATDPHVPLLDAAAEDPDAPARPVKTAMSVEELAELRATFGPRFFAAEKKLNDVRDLVRNLRDFARLDDLPTRPLQVPTLVTETVSMVRQDLAEKALSVSWSPSTHVPLVQGNAGKLKRALYNVLTFLTESAPPESGIKIAVTPPPPGVGTDRILTLTMSGQTPGLTAELAKHLFEPFAKLHSPSGLGLPIAMSIVREHGGSLEATRREGPTAETTFTVRLPTL